MTETCTTEQVPNPGYIPPSEGYWATVENPDYVPAVPETKVFDGYMKWNWTGGPLNYVPAAPGGTDDWGWHQVGITNDSKGETPDVVHQGNGKASFFYYESVYTVTPAIPEQGTPTTDVWVEGSPAVGEEFLIEVTCEEPPILNPPVFQWVTGEPVIDCEGMTVTVVSHEEAAGWYWGDDGEQYLGGFFPTGNEASDVRPANAEECPAPPPEEEESPAIDTPEYKPDTETQTVQDVSQPEQLAVTGGGPEWTALIIGAVFVVAGLVLYLKRPKR